MDENFVCLILLYSSMCPTCEPIVKDGNLLYSYMPLQKCTVSK
jgi:hypothetical protein